ncbi:WcaI family glycosyltransferase [Sphingobium sp. DC-2]|uniref:WcaI family glycosyltransferase n=1 Tax=Sphingobium sp. DC-2 TaxID=1303256 RepID=UPI0004C305CF|nr:WcaI family glycosyltransferase [Sphingobium sp. DC-2]
MKVLIIGLNYAPEPIGIGPYTRDMATFLAQAGTQVSVVSAAPYYPHWRVAQGYSRFLYRHAVEEGVSVTRCPIYVPENPTGFRRIIHHLSFVFSALIPVMLNILFQRPDVVIAIAPSLMSAPLTRMAGRLSGARTWVHVQDFEVEAAFATGLVAQEGRAARLALAFQCWAFRGFDRYSSISPQMCAKLARLLPSSAQVLEVRNWADMSLVESNSDDRAYRAEWALDGKQIALYSGNVSRKQGIGIVVDAARKLKRRDDIRFVICGEGPEMIHLAEATRDLPNVLLKGLQPREQLGSLLSLASVHLLPQIEGAADLVLPSKLTNMLASGRPVIATARAETGLAWEIEGCGLAIPPGDADAFSAAVEAVMDSPAMRSGLGEVARQRARERWSKAAIMSAVQAELSALCMRDLPKTADTITDAAVS